MDTFPLEYIEPSTSIVNSAVRSVWLRRLANDLILFGEADLNGVLASYGLGLNDYKRLAVDPEFIGHIQVSAKAASTLSDQVRLAAKTAMFVHVATLNMIAGDDTNRPEDRIKAIKELREMGHIDTEMSAEAAAARAAGAAGAGGGGLTIVIGGRGDQPSQTVHITPTEDVEDVEDVRMVVDHDR